MTPWLSPYRRRQLRLWGPVFIIAFVSVLTALLLWVRIDASTPQSQRIERLVESGELDPAEQLAWNTLIRNPNDVETWIRFIDLHAAMRQTTGDENFANDPIHESSITEQEIQQLLQRISDPHSRTLARFWYETRAEGGSPDRDSVRAVAESPKPARFANYLLARTAMENDNWAAAARHLEREALAHPQNRKRFLQHAVGIWMNQGAWDELKRIAADRRYREVVDSSFRLELAIHWRDWPSMLLWLWPAAFSEIEPFPIALAVLSAILWFLIAAKLGRVGDEPGRLGLYGLSFLLGVVSIYPTLLLIMIEEDLFGLRQLGQPIPDAIYFIFGVGLREELGKLLLFLPLVPVLLRRGSRLEAMTCAAIVGLGFAAEENVNYFHMGDPGTAIGRFLTANFLHMTLTSLVGLSLFDSLRGRTRSGGGFSSVFPIAVLIHGAYDFFLTSEQFAEMSFISMALFVILSQRFLRQLLVASSSAEQEGVLRMLVWSMAALTGVSYIYATTLAGPWIAIRVIALGLLGVAIIIYMFVRELAT